MSRIILPWDDERVFALPVLRAPWPLSAGGGGDGGAPPPDNTTDPNSPEGEAGDGDPNGGGLSDTELQTWRTDFSEHGTGTVPADWASVLTHAMLYSIEAAGVGGKKNILIVHDVGGAGTPAGAAWLKPGDLGDAEILYRWKVSRPAGNTGTAYPEHRAFTLAGMLTGDPNVYGYSAGWNSTAGGFMNRHAQGAASTNLGNFSFAQDRDIWVWTRFRTVGVTTQVKAWLEPDPEPTDWILTHTAADTTARPQPGKVLFYTTTDYPHLRIDQLAVSGAEGTTPLTEAPGPNTPGTPVVIDVSDMPAPSRPPVNLQEFHADPLITHSLSLRWWMERLIASMERTSRNPDSNALIAKNDLKALRQPKDEIHYLFLLLKRAKDVRILYRLRDMLNAMLANLSSTWTLNAAGVKSKKYLDFESNPAWLHGGGYAHLLYREGSNAGDAVHAGTDTHILEELLGHDPIAVCTVAMLINADLDPTFAEAGKKGGRYLLDHWEPKWEKRLGRDSWGVLKFRKAISHAVSNYAVIETCLVAIKQMLGRNNAINIGARDRLAFRLASDREQATAPNGYPAFGWRHQNAPTVSEQGGGSGNAEHKMVYQYEHYGAVAVLAEMNAAGFEVAEMAKYANGLSQLIYKASNLDYIAGGCANDGKWSETGATAFPNLVTGAYLPFTGSGATNYIRRAYGGSVMQYDATPNKDNIRLMARQMNRLGQMNSAYYTFTELELAAGQAWWQWVFAFTLLASYGVDGRDYQT
jgi:hypothetical protein